MLYALISIEKAMNAEWRGRVKCTSFNINKMIHNNDNGKIVSGSSSDSSAWYHNNVIARHLNDLKDYVQDHFTEISLKWPTNLKRSTFFIQWTYLLALLRRLAIAGNWKRKNPSYHVHTHNLGFILRLK